MSQTPNKAAPRKLGRGLSHLLSPDLPVEVPPPPHLPAPAKVSNEETQAQSPLTQILVSEIEPNKFQPRREFPDESIRALAQSIKESGVIQPIIVRKKSGIAGAGYELIAGERRLRAAVLAGLEKIPAIVREVSDLESAQWALVENVQREDLNAIDKGLALAALCARFGLTQQQAGERVGLDRSSVANLIRLTELPAAVRALIAEGKLSAGHGKALLSVGDLRRVEPLAARAAQEGWSVRRLEMACGQESDLALSAGSQAPEAPAGRGAIRADLERRLGEALGTRAWVRANAQGTKGSITLAFYDLDHLEGLLRKLGVATPH